MNLKKISKFLNDFNKRTIHFLHIFYFVLLPDFLL